MVFVTLEHTFRAVYESFLPFGLEVVRLKRNAEGVVKLGMLKPGTYRELTKAEINGLRSAAAKGRAQTRSAALQSKAAERRPRGSVGKSAPKKRK